LGLGLKFNPKLLETNSFLVILGIRFTVRGVTRIIYVWFLTSLLGIILILPVHFLSVEHLKLERKFGIDKGTKIGDILGIISGWGFFIFWIGIWVSPQPGFTVSFFHNLETVISIGSFSIPFLHFLLSIPFIFLGVLFGIKGVKLTTLKVAETHRPEKIVTNGVYSKVRHPQYFGGLLAHVGISFLLSAEYSLFLTPLMTFIIYLISKKEEKELIKEFGKEYLDYKKKVPMLLPKF
jgi:protein-S-isoprenylcysteine O-methyltransferase Ste14